MSGSEPPSDIPGPVRPASTGGNPYMKHVVRLNQPKKKDMDAYEEIGLANSIGFVRKDNAKLLMDARLVRTVRGFGMYYHHDDTHEGFTLQLAIGANLFRRKGLITEFNKELLGIGVPQYDPQQIHGLIRREFAPFVGWPIRFASLVPIIGEEADRRVLFIVRKGDKEGEFVLDLPGGGIKYDQTDEQAIMEETRGEMKLKISFGRISISFIPGKQTVKAEKIGVVHSNETRKDGRFMRRIINIFKATVPTDFVPASNEKIGSVSV